MAHWESPPFGRGETFANGGAIDSNNLPGTQLPGTEWLFEDLQWNTPGVIGAKPNRTNRLVLCRIVRNTSLVNILPGQLVTFQKTGTTPGYGAHVDGLVCTTADRCYVADEWLPAAGVPPNDLFWIVVKGPALVWLPLAGSDFGSLTSISVGNVLVGLTAATSGATTAGRATNQDLTGATALLGNQLQNAIGRALSAATSGNTNAQLLVEVGRW
jgi:hypothetical protein